MDAHTDKANGHKVTVEREGKGWRWDCSCGRHGFFLTSNMSIVAAYGHLDRASKGEEL